MSEDTRTIGEWADQTFGHVTPLSAALRVAKEAHELVEAAALVLTHGVMEDRLALELADVQITLHRLAHVLGVDIPALVEVKMATNRRRKWRLDGRGGGQHE